MSPAVIPDPRVLHERLGKVRSQPLSVSSFTNKRLTINFRVPLGQLRRVVPAAIGLDEIRDTGHGMLSMCVCDFWVTRLGPVPIVPFRNNDMLCRVSATVPRDGHVYRAYYTLRSDSSSRLFGFLGRHFSHYRKRTSRFTRLDDGRVYALECRADDPICGGSFRGAMTSLQKEPPATTVFADVREATEFVFQLDGSCGYEYGRDRLSFQKIEYPPWDIQFCHEYDYRFPLIDHLAASFRLDLTLDCVLFMEKVPQVWGAYWLYPRPPGATLANGESGGSSETPPTD
jgi:hypothetical protein